VEVEREIVIEPGLEQVLVDRDQIGRVLVNLIQNAADAMNGQGRLRLAARGTGTELVIEVADTGEGIEAENLEKIFEPLYTTKPNGTGLGLSICRNIVTAHGGSLTVQSERHRGSIFRITLPSQASRARAIH